MPSRSEELHLQRESPVPSGPKPETCQPWSHRYCDAREAHQHASSLQRQASPSGGSPRPGRGKDAWLVGPDPGVGGLEAEPGPISGKTGRSRDPPGTGRIPGMTQSRAPCTKTQQPVGKDGRPKGTSWAFHLKASNVRKPQHVARSISPNPEGVILSITCVQILICCLLLAGRRQNIEYPC